MSSPKDETPSKRGGLLRLAIGLPIAAVFAWLAFGRIDWSAAGSTLAEARLMPLIAALALLGVDFSLRTLRWWWMLRTFDKTLPTSACFAPFFGSFAANNILPMRAGDLIRIVGFRHHIGAPAMRILGTMVIERLLDLFMLLAIFFVGLHSLADGAINPKFITGAKLIAGIALGLLVFLIVAERLILRGVRKLEASDFARQRGWLMRGLKWFDQALSTVSIFRSPTMVLALCGFSIAAWLCEGAVFYCVAWSLGIEVPPIGAWFAMSTGTLATLLPSSPGYVGTFDYFAMRGIIAYGAAEDPAAAFTLLAHLMMWLPVTIVGGLFLLAPRGRRALHDAQTLEASQLDSETSTS